MRRFHDSLFGGLLVAATFGLRRRRSPRADPAEDRGHGHHRGPTRQGLGGRRQLRGDRRLEPLVASGTSKGDGTKNGDTRTLTLKNGGVLHESLDEYDAARRSYSYRLDDPDLKALPVSSYSATLTVTRRGRAARCRGSGASTARDTGNEPPEELSDAAGRATMKAYLEAGLAGLKAKVEGGP